MLANKQASTNDVFAFDPLLFVAFGCVSSWDKRAWDSSQSYSVVMHGTPIGFYYIRGHFSGGCAHVVTPYSRAMII
jgi:hypothetical protein